VLRLLRFLTNKFTLKTFPLMRRRRRRGGRSGRRTYTVARGGIRF